MAFPFQSQYGSITPRHYQLEGIEKIFSYFYDGKTGHPLVVMPTGSGKAIQIALFIYITLSRWPDQRILVASHVKELVQQDFDALCKVWPRPDAGIYCASLGQRRFADAVTFATVQSIAKKAHIIGRRNIFIIDEAHLLSDDDNSQYRKLIAGLLEINPDASWDAEPREYRLRDITRVDFGGDYEDALHLVGGWPDAG